MGNLDKVPSVISYSPSSGAQERQWGASLSPEAVAMVHTKLQLEVHNTLEELDLILQALDGMGDLDFQHVQKAGGLPSYTWKGPEMIVEDYLTKVFDAFLPAIEEMAGLTEEVRAQMLTDIVVTIPAVCHRVALFCLQPLKPGSRAGPTGPKTLYFAHLLELDSPKTLSQG
jgi:hypothetical protein